MENAGRTALPSEGAITAEDLKALAAIKTITKRGDNVEVRQKNGKLTIYSVSKRKEI